MIDELYPLHTIFDYSDNLSCTSGDIDLMNFLDKLFVVLHIISLQFVYT